MKTHILHNGLHRIGDQPARILDNERFLSRDPWNDLWMTRPSFPSANVKENKEHYDLEIALPGFSKEEVKIEVDDQYLHVIAEKKNTSEMKKEPNYIRIEYNARSLHRSFDLPDHIKREEVEAYLENGVLKIKLPYKKNIINKKIEIL